MTTAPVPGPMLGERLRAGETIVSAWCALPEPVVMEVVARAGFDCVTIDLQHGLGDTASLMRGVGGVLLAGKPALVRVPLHDFALASRALDMGVEGVIAPMINTVEDARALVATTKYPPVGERSWGPTRVLGLRGVDGPTYLASANKTALALAMIETERALGAVDAILAVEGLDGIFVGPSDLSLTLSGGRSVAPGDAALEVPLRRIAESAKRAGKIAGIFSPTAERARVFRDLGYPFVALGTDFAYLRSGAEAMLAAAGLRR